MNSATGINRNAIYGQLKSPIAQVCHRHVREIRAGHRLAEDLHVRSKMIGRLSSAINQNIAPLGASVSVEEIRSVSTVRDLCTVVCSKLTAVEHQPQTSQQMPSLSLVEWFLMALGFVILISFWAYVMVFA
jgi:hypothetical protein